MNISFLSFPIEIIAGLMIGVMFGFILNKANVTRFSTIVQQLLLKDFTVMKVIMTAIATGSLLLYFLKDQFHYSAFIITPTTLTTALLGGGIFGIGMAVLGFCPGTCVGALSTRAKDAWFGVVGMILGAGLYAEVFPWIEQSIKPREELSKITLPEYFEISPWFFIGGAVLCVLCFIFFDTAQKKPLMQSSQR